jgi:hypothetical protein
MQFSFVVASLLSLACVVNAANFTVQVGPNSTLTYSPTSVSDAMEGDNIIFMFSAKNHTATQSTFANPCTRNPNGFASGFMPFNGTGDQPVFVYTVTNASAPTWVYCGQTGHCQKGMVFAINPPAEGNTFDKFQANALALASTTSASSSLVYGATPSATATGTGSAASGTSSTTSAGMKVGGSAAGALAIALLVGLAL